MKKLFLIVLVSATLAACNNSSDSTSAKKDSLDSIGNAAKNNVDSTTKAEKDQLDSGRKEAKDQIDSTIDKKKQALDRRDSIHRADSIKMHSKK